MSREATTEEAEASRVRLKLLERRLQLRRLYRKVLLTQVLLNAERCAPRRRAATTRARLPQRPATQAQGRDQGRRQRA